MAASRTNTVPLYVSDLILEAMKPLNLLQNQGLVTEETQPLLARGGEYVELRHIRNIGYSSAMQYNDGATDIVPAAIGDFIQRGVVVRGMGGLKDIDVDRVSTGADALPIVVPQVAEAVSRLTQDSLIASLKGAFESALSAHVVDKSAVGDTLISYENVIDATQSILGEAQNLTKIMVIHSKIQNDLLRSHSISYVNAGSLGERAITDGVVPTFAGKRVIINDTLCAPTDGVYPTYILPAEPLYLWWQRRVMLENDNDLLKNGGEYYLIYRWDYVPHLKGMSYATSAGTKPTNTILATGSSWTKANTTADAKQFPYVKLLTK